MNGHTISQSTMIGGITRAITSSLPSFSIWNSQRKYQSGRGSTTARGSADCSSSMFFWTSPASRPTVTTIKTAMIG